MEIIFVRVRKIADIIFSTRAAGMYMLLFALAIAIATFVENDFGTSSAQKLIFKSWWFELLLILFGGCILFNIQRFNMIRQKRWALLMFHVAMIIILLGAGITRYFGFEGMMHIRENDVSNSFLSSETYLLFDVVRENRHFHFDEPVMFASLGHNKFEESYLIGNDLLEVRLKQFIPNPVQVVEPGAGGAGVIKIVVSGMSGREEHYLQEGDSRRIHNTNYNFTDVLRSNAVNFIKKKDGLFMVHDRALTRMVMVTQQIDTLAPHLEHLASLRSLYSNGISSFVITEYLPEGNISFVSNDPKIKNESVVGLILETKLNGLSKEIQLFGRKGVAGRKSQANWDNFQLAISYGSKRRWLPFGIKLYDFQMERYPGTNSAASYASEVQLIDEQRQVKQDYRIFMNHILNYGGYRFFQSSFDQDEQGTYLSVNHDFWGTWISYFGYFLLTLGLILSLFNKKSRFYMVSQKIKRLRSSHVAPIIIGLLVAAPFTVLPQKVVGPEGPSVQIDADHAKSFSQLLVQDYRGRMKPVHTLSREILRKISKKEELYGLNADQVVLGMYAGNQDWNQMPIIKLGKHEDIKKKIGVLSDHAAYSDFFSDSGGYKLQAEVRRAYNLKPIDRGVYEKELLKLDEKVNIASMVFSGRIFKLVPLAGDANNLWVSHSVDAQTHEHVDLTISKRFFESYHKALSEALTTADYSLPNQILQELSNYQQSEGGAVAPSPIKTKAEILLNNLNVFGRLSAVYLLLGLAFLGCLFISVFNPSIELQRVYRGLFYLIVAAFIFHTLGLGLRWYVSGRAPWSNGYESMIYIAWTTTLAGLIFMRKSLGGLAATMVLAATVLLVATLSYLDPEITPLVPVLRSYWLTIHVSLVAGSYGFLMLGAVTGLINLIMMIFLSQSNRDRIVRIIREMSFISEMTLIGGLIMISVGTYLGGVWANESWGRYWGWDAKETWALVTILIYAFILHMRIIPKMNGLFVFNFATLFGWASVIMTYFGVNYYLSGLHSYAAGDPVPIPQWVYISVMLLIIISILAYWKKRKYAVTT